jgi:predicted amidohydrolase YtcJ
MTDATLWSGGRVFTGERYVESLLVENGRVLAAGPDDATRRQAPTGVEREMLDGRLVLPGLVDAHLHLAEIARASRSLDLTDARSFDAIRTLVRRWDGEHPVGPIVGRGWHEARLKEGRAPTLREIDPAVPHRAVVLVHESGHAALLNSTALAAVGIDGDSGAAPPATVGRFPDGRPNGLLYEDALRSLSGHLDAELPISAPLLESTARSLLAFGLTRAGTMSTGPDEATALKELAEAGRLPITIRAYPRLVQLDDFPDSLLRTRSDRFALVGAKAFVDGAFGPRTAWLSEPYADDPSQRGIPIGDEETLARRIEEAVDRGLAPSLHAIGDAALDRAARLLERWASRPGPPARIEHVALTPPPTLELLDRVRPTLVVQPGFLWSDWWLPSRIGAGRSRWAYLFRTLADRGHRVAASSDAPCDPVDPWRGLRAAVARRDPLGRSANPDPAEGLTGEEALGAYTRGAAEALGDRAEGRLEPGCSADLVVLHTATLVDALRSSGLPVRETWVGGRRVHSAEHGAIV